MNPFNYYTEAFKKYAVFNGRASRAEFWWFILFNNFICFVLFWINVVVSASAVREGASSLNNLLRYGLNFLTILYIMGTIIPSLAVEVRRLHDTNRSGWWILISFIPIVGGIILFVFLVQDSQPGNNKYGPNPKELKPG